MVRPGENLGLVGKEMQKRCILKIYILVFCSIDIRIYGGAR